MYQPKDASKMLGVTVKTIQTWDKQGKIKCIRTPSNRRLIPESEIKRIQGEKEIRNVYLYARVSTYGQRKDLNTQISVLKMRYPNAKLYQDIASGMNFKRKGLKKLLDDVRNQRVSTVVVVHKDRLTRFGFDFFEEIFGWFGSYIEVLETKTETPNEELVSDMIAIITSFTSRLYGMRSHKSKKIIDTTKAIIDENDSN